MKKQKNTSTEATELRRRAEERLRENKTEGAPARTDKDTHRLLHELRVHQIELEMQNEELRQVRDEVEAGLTRYTDLYDFAPVGYLTLGRDGAIRQVNLTGARLLGVVRSRLAGRRFGRFVCEADSPEFNAFLRKVFERQAREACEVALLIEGNHPPSAKGYGKAGLLHVRIEAAASENGQECRAALLDITERKRAEDELRGKKEILRSYEILKTILENAPIMIAFLDPNGAHKWVNQAWERILGWSLEEAQNRDMLKEFYPDPGYHKQVIDFIEESKGIWGDFTIRRRDGTVIDVSWASIKLSDGSSIRIGQDITDRKRMEEERLIMSKLESTGILAGGIAHDFNNLLAVILGNLELAKMLAQPGGEMGKNLEAAQRAVWTARDLTQQLITFAKGGVSVREVISLSGVIEEAVTFVLRGSPVKCELSISPELWQAKVDESQIGQVIRNLVLNAREAMPKGGTVSMSAENVVLGSEKELSLPAGNYMKVTIADQGRGIPEEILPRIFDPYFSTKQRGDRKGVGLGLTICHSVIKIHGGAITVASKEGVGTTFHIYLPASHEMIQEERAPATVQEVLPGTGRVLVMDDEEMLRNLAEAALRQSGYKVDLAGNGEKAVELYRKAKESGQPFDAVILDLTVRGGMGGVQTIKALRKIDPSVKAMVLSGYADDPVMVDYERYGFRGALAKPYGIGDLSKTLARVMGS